MIDKHFQRIVRQYPDRIAIAEGAEALSYRALWSLKEAFCNYLSHKLELEVGDRIVVLLLNSTEFIVSFLAIAKLGAVCIPLNPELRSRELEFYLDTFRVSAVITTSDLQARWPVALRKLSSQCLVLVDMAEPTGTGSLQRTSSETFEDQEVVYLSTSGSTGTPRVVARSQGNLLAGIRSVAEALAIKQTDKFLSVVPFHHANGFANCMLLPLLNGASMVLMRKFVSRQLIELVQKERISVLIGSPFIFRMLAEHVEDPLSFASVRICLSSGAPMPRNLTERFLNEFSLTVRQQYGSSETGTIAIEAEDEALGATVGPPLANVEVKIIGETGAELPAGETGEILVKSATMTNGYVGEHVDNRKFFHQGFFRTRDLGFIDQRGNLVLTGRMKRLINVAGIKVDPVEVENVLKSHPGVKDVSVHAEIGKLEMEVLKATIVALPGSGLSRSKIIKHCREHLAEFKIPRIIEFKASLPVNLLGKRVLLSR